MLAVRMRVVTEEVVEALVEVRDRFATGGVGVAFEGVVVCVSSGRGNGTGVCMSLSEEAMAVNVQDGKNAHGAGGRGCIDSRCSVNHRNRAYMVASTRL